MAKKLPLREYEAFLKIEEIKKKFPNEVKLLNEHEIWPILKQTLWTYLTNPTAKAKTKYYSKINVNYFIKLYLFLKIIFEFFFRRSHKIYFFSRPVYIENFNNQKYDRVVDPIVNFFHKKKIKYIKYYLGKSKNIELNNYKSSYLPFNNFFKFITKKNSKICDKDIKIIKKIIKNLKLNLNFKKLFVYLNNNITELNKSKFIFNLFFFFKKKNSVVFITSFYFPDMLGLIYVSKKFGHKIIELQHGKQGNFQAMYNCSEFYSRSLNFLPSNFWCWGLESSNNINNNFKFYKIAYNIGYPWLNFVKKNLNIQKIRNQLNIDDQNRVILFSLQSTKFDDDFVPTFLLRFLNSIYIKNYKIIFKLHPNDNNEKIKLHLLLKNENPNNFIIVNDIPIAALLLLSNYHLTAYSSSCFEAEFFDIPNLLYGKESKNIYKDKINDTNFIWLNETISPLKFNLKLAKIFNLKTNTLNKFIKEDLTYLKKEILHLSRVN